MAVALFLLLPVLPGLGFGTMRFVWPIILHLRKGLVTVRIQSKVPLCHSPGKIPLAVDFRKLPGLRNTRVAGALPYKLKRDLPFLRVSFCSINLWTEYENWSEIPKQVMTICSRTIGYCFKNNRLLFPYCFANFCNRIIPKQGIEMHFFRKQVVEILKKWAPPRQVTFKPPPEQE